MLFVHVRPLMVGLFCLFVSTASAQSIQSLGQLPNELPTCAADVSGDGRVVVGNALGVVIVQTSPEGFRWSEAGGMQGLGLPAGDNARTIGEGASGDGSVVVGTRRDDNTFEAIRWVDGAPTQLPPPDGAPTWQPNGVSADGSVIVGRALTLEPGDRPGAVRWTASGGIDYLPTLVPDGGNVALDVSTDGTVIVGRAPTTSGRRAVRWANGAIQDLGLPDASFALSEGVGISGDGEVIVGVAYTSDLSQQPIRWTAERGMEVLDAPERMGNRVANDANVDGSIIVGELGLRAYIWTSEEGGRFLDEVLTDEFGVDLSGWALNSATAISDDGTVIAGCGSTNGSFVAWRVELPSSDPGVLVQDVNRFGRPTGSLTGVTVTLNDGTQDVASSVTDSRGRVDFSNSGVDLSLIYDVRLERDSLFRTYQSVRPATLGDSTLALPATLVERLGESLAALDTTDTLVLGYDTEAARRLVEDWSGDAFPELPDVHAGRDSSVARLLIAAEALGDVFRSARPLAQEAAAVTVDGVMTLLSFRKLLQELNTSASQTLAAGVRQGTTTPAQSSLATRLFLRAA
ncbi:MAG: hypothetical protein AAFQ53_15135, partial [Bacteroidota bacterium]